MSSSKKIYQSRRVVDNVLQNSRKNHNQNINTNSVENKDIQYLEEELSSIEQKVRHLTVHKETLEDKL
jgi:hypothetical protein